MKRSFGGLALAVAVMALATPVFAGVDAFLQIDGVQGLSPDKPGAIDLESWSFSGGHAPPEGAALGRGADQASVRKIVIVKEHDQASAKLMQAAASGEHFKQAILFVRKAGGQPYLEYRMENVTLTNYSMSSGAGRPTESMTLTFQKVEVIDGLQGAQTPVGARGLMPGNAHPVRPGAN